VQEGRQWPELEQAKSVLWKDDEQGMWILCHPCSIDNKHKLRDQLVWVGLHKNWACIGTGGKPFSARLWNDYLKYKCHIWASKKLSNKKTGKKQTAISAFLVCPATTQKEGHQDRHVITSSIASKQKAPLENKYCLGLFKSSTKSHRTGLAMMSNIRASWEIRNISCIWLQITLWLSLGPAMIMVCDMLAIAIGIVILVQS